MHNSVQLFGITFEITSLKTCSEVIFKTDKTPAKYICLPDMYVVSYAYNNSSLKTILNNSFLTLPDGKPIQFVSRLKGIKGLHTISGYWLIRELLATGLTHYFYGGNENTLELMISNIKKEFPGSKIAGFKAPPMLALENIEYNQEIIADINHINKLKPDIIWVGISSPKQDFLVYHHHKNLEHGIMVTIGGVFDYLLDPSKKSSEWVKKIGLRWLYRMLKEPRRLWPKYWYTIKTISTIFFKRLYVE